MPHAPKPIHYGIETLESLPIAVYLKDSRHRFVYLNNATAKALGLSIAQKDKALGRTDKDFFTPDLVKTWHQQESMLLRPDARHKSIMDQYEEEEHLARKGRKAKPNRVFTSKMVVEIGGEKFILGFSKPILKHEGIEKMSLAVRGTQAGLWYINYTTGEVWLSQRWKQMLGYQDHELKNERTTFRRLVHRADRKKVSSALTRYFANPEDEKSYHCVFRMRCKSGEWKWIESYGQASFGAKDSRVEFAGSHFDVTERTERMHLHEAILKALPALIYLKNDKKEFVYLNAALAKVFGKDAAEIVGDKLRDCDLNTNDSEVQHFELDDQKILSGKKDKLIVPLEQLTSTTGRKLLLNTSKMAYGYPLASPRRHILGLSTNIIDSTKTLVDSLREMSACLNEMDGARSEDAVCQVALRHLRKVGPEASCMISFKEEHKGRPAIIGRPDLATGTFAEIAPDTVRYCDVPKKKLDILPWVLRYRKAQRYEFVSNSQTDPRCDRELCAEHGIKAQFIVPLFAEDKEFGTLQVAFKDVAAQPSHVVTSIKLIATSLSLGIERLRTNAKLEKQNAELLYASSIPVIVHAMHSRVKSLVASHNKLQDESALISEDVPEINRHNPSFIDNSLLDLRRHVGAIAADFDELGSVRIVVSEFDVMDIIESAKSRYAEAFKKAKIKVVIRRKNRGLKIRGVAYAFLSIILDRFENTLRAFREHPGTEKRTMTFIGSRKHQGHKNLIYLDISDSGPGIPIREVPKLFDRTTNGIKHGLTRTRELLLQEPFCGEIKLVNQASPTKGRKTAHFRITVNAAS